MDQAKKRWREKRIARTMENLEKNQMKAYFVETREEVLPLVESLLCPGDTVAAGGSVTLKECGVLAHLGSGQYHYLDRYRPGITKDETEEVFHAAFSADVYLTSANAITEAGELYNVDGNSNRVPCILYGPRSVIVVAGINKLVRDLNEAIIRVKSQAAPANCMRLDCETYCRETGQCKALRSGETGMTSGCTSPGRICCNFAVSARQRHKDRIKVILVGEELGY